MKAFKYVIPPDIYVEVPTVPGLAARGCAALVVAGTREEADALLDARLAALGCAPWRPAAAVTELALDTAAVALVVQT